MATYKVLRDTFIAHTSRLAKAGEIIDVDFPPIKRHGMPDQPMKMGSNLELVEDALEPEAPRKGR
jgi:hypothetical protein